MEHGPPVRREGETVRDDQCRRSCAPPCPRRRPDRASRAGPSAARRGRPSCPTQKAPSGPTLPSFSRVSGLSASISASAAEDSALRIEAGRPRVGGRRRGGRSRRSRSSRPRCRTIQVSVRLQAGREAMDRPLGDVALPERVATVVEDRPLAQGAAGVVQRLELEGHRSRSVESRTARMHRRCGEFQKPEPFSTAERDRESVRTDKRRDPVGSSVSRHDGPGRGPNGVRELAHDLHQ